MLSSLDVKKANSQAARMLKSTARSMHCIWNHTAVQ